MNGIIATFVVKIPYNVFRPAHSTRVRSGCFEDVRLPPKALQCQSRPIGDNSAIPNNLHLHLLAIHIFVRMAKIYKTNSSCNHTCVNINNANAEDIVISLI